MDTEFYVTYFKRFRDEKFIENNSSSEQLNSFRNLKQYGWDSPFAHFEYIKILGHFLKGRDVTEELIIHLVENAVFHFGNGDKNRLIIDLKNDFLK